MNHGKSKTEEMSFFFFTKESLRKVDYMNAKIFYRPTIETRHKLEI